MRDDHQGVFATKVVGMLDDRRCHALSDLSA
jgi:hypothetical protein